MEVESDEMVDDYGSAYLLQDRQQISHMMDKRREKI
jgi:hypothetical protein